jgi:hypothetical protein
MRRLFALALLTLSPLLPAADETPAAKPNTLTPDEVSRGWLLLFDGETTFGWAVDGEATVEKGALVLGGTKKTVARTTTRFGDRAVSFQAEWSGEETPTFRADSISLGKLERARRVPYRSSSSFSPRQPADGLIFEVPAGSRLRVWNVKLLPLGPGGDFDFGGGREQRQLLTPLFNGTDLSGWKVFEGKGKKSKYTVTKEGWLNVKDGPGDLQTEKRFFDDFVLQLECKSNGKHLNSGLFFRCLPGKYQQGYEAQIRNQFTDKPTQKYTVEEYDPKTHKLVGKKTILSTAVDYGTGAIYRRMPARKGVAKDREWFTMTVVARGRHFSTWVNGVQVVDWTDNRPASDNARNGYRAEAGAISIQGHDPTTDLDFRNIRIAPLKP